MSKRKNNTLSEKRSALYSTLIVAFFVAIVYFAIITTYGIYNYYRTSQKILDSPFYINQKCNDLRLGYYNLEETVKKYEDGLLPLEEARTQAKIDISHIKSSIGLMKNALDEGSSLSLTTLSSLLVVYQNDFERHPETVLMFEVDIDEYTYNITKESNIIIDDLLSNATVTSILIAIINAIFFCILIGILFGFRKQLIKKDTLLLNRSKLFNTLSKSLNYLCAVRSGKDANLEFITDNIEAVCGFNYMLYQKEPEYYDKYFVDGKNLLSISKELINNPEISDYRIDIKIINPLTSEEFIFEYNAFHSVNDDGVDVLISSLNDVTEIRKHNEQMAIALNQANEANIAKRNFLSHISHEIRTPMNAIVGITELAKNSLNKPDITSNYLNKIKLSSTHLLKLINDILEMSKIESQKLAIHNDPFAFRDMITQVNNIAIANSSENNQLFSVIYDSKISDFFLGDSLRIAQVLINIINNSIKFTPAKGRIIFRIKQVTKNDKAFLTFEIADSGIGISKEFLSKIFLPFEQEKNNTKIAGTGLGLSIAHNIIESMGGKIEVTSTLNVGTTFTVSLTLDILEENEYSLPNLKVLLLSDKDHYTHILEELTSMNITCDYQNISDFKEPQNKYDFYICDLDCNNDTVIQIAKKHQPCILTSSLDLFSVSNMQKEVKAYGFILKPLVQKEIYEVMLNKTSLSVNQEKIIYDFSGYRILLVEDNELNMEIARELLETRNLKVECAGNGYIGLNMFEKSEKGYYNAILMDINMPVMDGIEATKKIRLSSHPDSISIPIIAMTAEAFKEEIEGYMEIGMNDYIGKPVDVEEMLKTIKLNLKK